MTITAAFDEAMIPLMKITELQIDATNADGAYDFDIGSNIHADGARSGQASINDDTMTKIYSNKCRCVFAADHGDGPNDNTIAWYENNGAAGPWDVDSMDGEELLQTIAWYENGIGYSYSWDTDISNSYRN